LKKTSVITINLRSTRLLVLLCLFLSVIYLSTILAQNLPAFSLGEDPIKLILSSNIAYNSSPIPTVGAFSFVRKEVIKNEKQVVSQPSDPPKAQTVRTPEIKNPNAVVKVNNSTNFSIVPEDYLSETPTFLKENFSVLIVHTHTTESYTPSEKYSYTPLDTDRTTDKKYNMVAVGNEIEKVLSERGIKVYHDTTINDYPSYSGSYGKSAMAIENHIKNDPSIKIVLDVHRDAIIGKNGEKVKYSTVIDGKEDVRLASGLEYWNSFDEKCISCGGCNTVCPTCACFDTVDVIYDETSVDGERRRVWSSCMLDTFTLTAGGGRARKTAGANMRFKVLHKTYDFKKRFGKENMCVGCGRCTARCPKDIDFAEVVNGFTKALETAKEAK